MSSQSLILIPIFLLSLNFFKNIHSKVVVVPDTYLEILHEGFDGPKYVDYTNFQVIPEDDTRNYFNGSINWLVDVNIWKTMVYAEQRLQGEWVFRALNRTYDNYCIDIKNPMTPSYKYFGKFNCPIAAGTKWNFDMVLFELPEYLMEAIPPHYFGRWRITTHHIFDDKEGIKREIVRFKLDLYHAN